MRVKRIAVYDISIAVLSAILAAGCSAPKGIDTSGPLTPESVMAAVAARNARILTLQGGGSISVETADLSNTGNIQLRLKLPDSLWVDITGPFGIGIARGVFTSRDFIYYSGYENTVVRGLTTAANLRSILRIPIEFNRIRAFIAGMGFDDAPREAAPVGELKDDVYRITYKTRDETHEYAVHTSYEAITRYTRRSAAGQIIEEIRYRDFRRKSDLYIPTIISMTRPGNSENLTLTFERLTLNESPVDFRFRYPKNAPEVVL